MSWSLMLSAELCPGFVQGSSRITKEPSGSGYQIMTAAEATSSSALPRSDSQINAGMVELVASLVPNVGLVSAPLIKVWYWVSSLTPAEELVGISKPAAITSAARSYAPTATSPFLDSDTVSRWPVKTGKLDTEPSPQAMPRYTLTWLPNGDSVAVVSGVPLASTGNQERSTVNRRVRATRDCRVASMLPSTNGRSCFTRTPVLSRMSIRM